MERRGILKAIGGVGTATVAGGAGIITFTDSASATADTDYGNVTITSDDGTVEYVAIYGKSTVEWDGFDSTATQFSLDIDGQVAGSGAGWVNLYESGAISLDDDTWGNYDESLSGPGTSGTIKTGIGLDENGDFDPTIDWHVVGSDPDSYALPENSIDPSLLEADSDGDTANFTVDIRATYTWYDSGDNIIFEKPFISSVNVEVNNEPQTASSSSSSSGATGE